MAVSAAARAHLAKLAEQGAKAPTVAKEEKAETVKKTVKKPAAKKKEG